MPSRRLSSAPAMVLSNAERPTHRAASARTRNGWEAGMETVRNPARERLERGELSLGVGVRLSRTVEIVKAMKTAGFDWLFIDLEHGPLTLDTASQISVAALDAGIAPIVRVPYGEFSMATRAL